MQSRTALIIGASRGLGLGLVREYLARGWHVIATERTAGSAGLSDAQKGASGRLTIEQLDIDDPQAIRALGARLGATAIDLLFVNAGVSDDPSVSIGDVATEEFTRVMQTNALSPLRAIEWLADRVDPRGTIAVMTSALGSVSAEPAAGYDLYGASKAALNRLMRGYAVRAGGERTLLAVMPGWVKTDMGGAEAPLDVATSARGIADAIDARSVRPGLSFIDYSNAELPW